MNTLQEFEEKKAAACAAMRATSGAPSLQKTTSNLFRTREAATARLDVRNFNKVLSIDTRKRTADVEGMTTYETLVDATLKVGLMPTVVPQLKTITIGGAVSGVGIESSSFKYGLVHETIEEMEILLSSGETVICSKKKNKDLFYGFPNSYGTLGYALRLRVKLVPVKPFVRLQHRCFGDTKQYVAALQKTCESSVDFVDGVIFDESEMYITTGSFVDKAPFVSDYTHMEIYYKSIRQREEDYLTVHAYIWRWDTDWFWCSKAFGVQNPLIRRFWGRKNLRSSKYWKLRAFALRHPLIISLSQGFSTYENIIQDVEIPLENCEKFLSFFHKTIGIKPIWVCPLRAYDKKVSYSLYPFNARKTYVNFGFWEGKKTTFDEGHYNKLIEEKVAALRGKKSLYSDSFYTEKQFWQLFDKKTYDALKRKYDPARKLKDLYQKCVMRK